MENLQNRLQPLLDEIEKRFAGEDDEYKTAVKQFKDALEFRNRFAKKVKYSSPAKKRILKLQLVDLDNKLEQLKQGFDKYHGACQKEEQIMTEHRQKMDELFDEQDTQLEKIYIIAKHKMPKTFFEGLHAKMFESITLEMQEEVLKRVSFLEETRLEEILAGK
jgi:UDP-galactopyranose mutase